MHSATPENRKTALRRCVELPQTTEKPARQTTEKPARQTTEKPARQFAVRASL